MMFINLFGPVGPVYAKEFSLLSIEF